MEEESSSEDDTGGVRKHPRKRATTDEVTRPAKRARQPVFGDYYDYVVIFVGPHEHEFIVHKKIICEKSEFFNAAFTGNWKGKDEESIRLPETDPRIFGIFVSWLYRDVVRFPAKSKNEPEPRAIEKLDFDALNAAVDDIIDCYAMADVLDCRRYRNALVDKFSSAVERSEVVPTMSEERWAKMRASSTLTRLWATYVASLSEERCLRLIQISAGEFVREIAAVMTVLGRKHRTEKVDMPYSKLQCRYHEHKVDSDRCRPRNPRVVERLGFDE